jgi:betaine-homocysteine S-methyltransferase
MNSPDISTGKVGLRERLTDGPVICAEGYLFELERRGYLQAGAFVPEVVIDNPEAVIRLHEDFVHAGTDIVEAFTYYAHREKLKLVGREDSLEEFNRQALRIAKDVADRHDCLMAGNICNTNIFDPGDPSTLDRVRRIFEEQIAWAKDEGADLLVAETLSFYGEAAIALDVMKQADLPTVVTLAVHSEGATFDGLLPADACRRLQDLGADVVGVNCIRGLQTLLPLVRDIRAGVSCHVAALPVPYRTNDEAPVFQALRDTACSCIPGNRPFPTALDPFTCNRYECADFARQCVDLDVRYIGLCCGAAPHHIRAMAEALGRTVPASRYSPDMSKHAFLGDDAAIPEAYKQLGQRL